MKYKNQYIVVYYKENTTYSVICIYASIEISIRKLVISEFYKTLLIYVFLVKCYNKYKGKKGGAKSGF